jgi:hypothetical protein
MTATKRNRVIAIVCFVFFVASFIAFNPGFLTSDSLDQYNQSLTGNYQDWHPPLMAFTWRMLNHIYEGPQVMLVMQLLFLWTSIYLLASSFHNKLWYIAIGAFALAPFVLNFAGNIFKDTQMALAWLLAFAILFRKIVKQRPAFSIGLIVSLLLILYGTWVRPNALPGALPLLLLWAWVACLRSTRRVYISTAIVLVMFTTAATFLFTGRIFNAEKLHAENKIFMHDLTGIFVKTGVDVFPSALYTMPGFDTSYLRQKYTPATFDFIWWNDDGKYYQPSLSDDMVSSLRQAWKHAISTYPEAYLLHRYEGFLYFLRLKKRTDLFVYSSPWVAENKYGFKAMGRGFHEAVFTHVDLHKNMPYMTPWFWFFTNVLLVPAIFVIKNRKFRIVYATLVLSSLMYVLPQFFIYQIDTEFRYVYWNCIACTIAIYLLIASRAINKNEERITHTSLLTS